MVTGGRQARLEALAEKYEEYRDTYLEKVKEINLRNQRSQDKAYMLAELDKLEAIFTDVEKYLEQNKGNCYSLTAFLCCDCLCF